MSGFTLQCKTIENGKELSNKHVFNGFGCEGQNITPEFTWQNPPEGTQSFAFTIFDPDAPTGSGWWHWIVVNIPATERILTANLPKGAMQVKNDYGILEFGGACPPKGDKPHRYIFTLYALSVERLDLSQNASAALASFNINANVIGKAQIIATYQR